MHNASRMSAILLLAIAVCACFQVSSWAQSSVHSVKVLGTKNAVEIEVDASDRIVPQTQVLSGPDRLVLDFPNAVPGAHVLNQSVDRGEVKSVRIGLFQNKPPITRVVVDLKSPRSYQIFPSGHTVMIKVMGDAPALTSDPGQQNVDSAANAKPYTQAAVARQLESSKPPLQVSYENGLLSIHANKATLSDVLYAVQQKTGAELSIAPGADQEQVVAEIAPGAASEVLARLLNGSKFNFLIMGAPNDPRQISRVILTSRGETGLQPLDPLSVEPPIQAQGPPSAVQSPAATPEAQADPPEMLGSPQPLPPDIPPHVPEEDELNK